MSAAWCTQKSLSAPKIAACTHLRTHRKIVGPFNLGSTTMYPNRTLDKNQALLVLFIESSVWEVNNFLSHFYGSCWQLSLYQPVVQGSKKPFEWLGRVISFNRIFSAVSEKAHSHAKSTCECFLYI